MADRAIADDAGREVTVSGVGALEKIYLQARLVRFSASPWLLSWRPALLWNSPTRNWRICLKELSICRTWVPFPAANCSHNDNHSTATKGQ